MKRFSTFLVLILGLSISFSACRKETDDDLNNDGINSDPALNPIEHPRLILKFVFDSTQVRLNAF
jgi:hypothetical protein